MEEKKTIKSGLKRRAITRQKQLLQLTQTLVLATAPAPQNSAATRDAVAGHPQERGGQQPGRQHVPRSRGKGAVSGKSWDKAESSEEPDPWGRRPDHAPGDLDLLTAVLQ